MPELRRDPITGRWVIISTGRENRPSSFGKYTVERKGGFCPFCEGNEEHTPGEILAYRTNGSERNKAGWSLRVVDSEADGEWLECIGGQGTKSQREGDEDCLPVGLPAPQQPQEYF